MIGTAQILGGREGHITASTFPHLSLSTSLNLGVTFPSLSPRTTVSLSYTLRSDSDIVTRPAPPDLSLT